MKKVTLIALTAIGMLSLTACNTSSNNASTPYSAAGTWVGSTKNVNNNNFLGQQRLDISDTNGKLTGEWFTKEDGGYIKTGVLSGSRDANNNAVINGTVTLEGINASAVFKGTFNGNTFKGNYTASEGGAGPFTFTRQ